MSRSIRSEYSAHQALSQTATRADWRAILAARDAKRTEYRYRQARRPQSGRIAPVLCALFVVAAALPAISFFS
jgi:hypothetical protein